MTPARSGTSNNPPTPIEIPEEADALLRCVYLYLGNPLRLNFIGWLRGHGFRFIASPPADHNGEKTVTARAPSGETYTVAVTVDPVVVAQACQAVRARGPRRQVTGALAGVLNG